MVWYRWFFCFCYLFLFLRQASPPLHHYDYQRTITVTTYFLLKRFNTLRTYRWFFCLHKKKCSRDRCSRCWNLSLGLVDGRYGGTRYTWRLATWPSQADSGHTKSSVGRSTLSVSLARCVCRCNTTIYFRCMYVQVVIYWWIVLFFQEFAALFFSEGGRVGFGPPFF